MRNKTVNPNDERISAHSWLVSLSPIAEPMLVYADNASEALDIYADHAFDNGWLGLFLDEETEQELEKFGEVTFVGNFGHPVNATEIYIKKVD